MKRVFLINNDHITLYRWDANRIIDAFEYPISASGKSELVSNIQKEPDVLSYIVIDVIEEEYLQETIPHVNGRDRKALLARKIKPLFRNALLKQSILQERESEGRRDDHILFSGIANTQTVSWLNDCLQSNKTPLLGIYSAPLLGAQVLKAIKVETKNNLLLSPHSGNRMRQSFYRHKHLKISRVSQANIFTEKNDHTFLEDEINTNIRYLQRIRLLKNAEDLDTYIISDQKGNSPAEPPKNTMGTRIHYLNINTIAQELGLSNRLKTHQFNILVAHIVCQSGKVSSYASSFDQRYYTMYLCNRGLIASAVAVFSLVIFISIYSFLSGSEYLTQRQIAEQQLEYLQVQHKNLRAALPVFPLQANDAGSLKKFYEKLEIHKPDPVSIYQNISKHLQNNPRIHLDSLKWTNQNTNDAGKLVITIKGRIAQFNGNYIESHAILNKLLKQFKENKVFKTVEATNLPINVNSNTNISGSSNEKLKANFEFTLVTRRQK